MNILHITNGLSEGGVETFLFSLSKELVNKGHIVSIMVLNKDECDLAPICLKNNIQVIRGKFRSAYNPLNIFHIYSMMNKYDVIHVHLFPTQYWVSIASFFKHCKFKILTTEHNTFNHRRKFKIFKYIDSVVYSAYSNIVGISCATVDDLDSWIVKSICKTPIILIYNGICIDRFSTISKLSKSHFNLLDSDKVLLMVARFNEQKDHRTVINALALLPNYIHLLLVGSGDTMDTFKELAKSKGVTTRVHFLGNRIDVPDIMKISDIGIVSSHWEGFGLVAIEYMAAGIPVLASNVLGLNEVVDNPNSLFIQGSERELAKKIKELLEDSKLYESLVNYSHRQINKFSLEKMVNSYLNLYKLMVHA